MPTPKQAPLPLLQPPQKLYPSPSQTNFIRLPSMQPNIRRAHRKRLLQQGRHIPLLKQFQESRRYREKVRILVS